MSKLLNSIKAYNDISDSIKYQLVGNPTEDEKKAAANKIWDICKESPIMDNAVMALIGFDAYIKIIGYINED